ncbi:MAG: hypothetical protein COU81_01545 [Candidatus Portnoybacteria bacterium CG10_big_fil_rev_8_21_14_0_10_36_7]|uniref:Uncharacterized protein n=1 Tax=Candidatus Portnoybacteria bacterium CG10_big_fil_rev_8_21_14_0_10_36_7 TaxID=1974812 RepID=A0A2M8KEF2_9BACT|nr:MAG: hypothetical protein COU81_01545 [Candidatus Portnoybacteria bacterium CG10_big_fil_rev_8_21_14_0_10_36_7]
MGNFPQMLEGVVHRIYPNGSHGPYALALIQGSEIVNKLTFSIKEYVCKENRNLQPDEVVCLKKIRKKRYGWRADEAYLWTTDLESSWIETLDLVNQVKHFASLERIGAATVHVEFRILGLEVLTSALRTMDEEKRLFFLILFLIWYNNFAESVELFGDTYLNFGNLNLFISRTKDGKALKVWYGMPNKLLENHAEGSSTLIEMHGPAEMVGKYLDNIIEKTSLKEVILPNGMNLYIPLE